jgi:hypothetical protein
MGKRNLLSGRRRNYFGQGWNLKLGLVRLDRLGRPELLRKHKVLPGYSPADDTAGSHNARQDDESKKEYSKH